MTRARLTMPALCVALLASPAPAQNDVSEDVFYQFMPIAWRDSDNDASRFGDFDGMTAGLDYLQSLGVTAVWMNPIFPSPAYHGYQHGRADQVDPRFGTEGDFLNFVAQAKLRGIDVYVDFVCYGISHDSPWYADAHGNPGSPYDDWLAFTNGSNTQYTGYTYNTWDGSSVGFINWDLRDAAASDLVTSWAEHWLDPDGDGDPSDGIAGYRLDHVWVDYNQGPGGWGYNLDTFWTQWHQRLKAVNPDVFTFCEQADWGSYGAEFTDVFSAAMTKPFEFAARDALSNGSAAPLYGSEATTVLSLAGHNGTYVAIIGDHDVDRLSSNIGATGGNAGRAKVAAAVLMTQPFTPMIYYGDEIGMLGTKQNYGSDANDIPMREPFKWDAVNNGTPMTNYHVLNSQAYNNAFSSNNDGRSVEEQAGVAGSLLETYRSLIATRRGSAALTRGGYAPVTCSSGAVWAFLRDEASQTALVTINLSGSTVNATLDLSGSTIPGGSTTPTSLEDASTLAPITNANKGAYPVSIPAYSWHIVEVSLTVPGPQPGDVDGRDIPTDIAGGLLATQTTATGVGNNLNELDQLFARYDGADFLDLGITGNLETNGNGLCLFIDLDPGGGNGQLTLNFSGQSPPPNGPELLTGTRMDDGFRPDHMLFVNTFGGNIYTDLYHLNPGGATKDYIGNGLANSGLGTLSGGTNPYGLQIAYDSSNTAGVTSSSAAGAATATTGFEMRIPLAQFGIPTGGCQQILVAATIIDTSGNFSNQWLPGLGAGQPNPGTTPDMRTIPGDQFVAIVLPAPADLTTTGAGVGDPGYGFPDGAITAADINFFVNAYVAADLAVADVTTIGAGAGDPGYGVPDGAITAADIQFYVNLWVLGCP